MAAFVSLSLVAGCGEFHRYEYISFEETPAAVVQLMAPAEFEGLFFGPTIPVEYLIKRDGYALRILIDERTSTTNATVELAEASGHKLVLRLWERGVRPGAMQPCGSIDTSLYPITRHGGINTPTRFTFLWIVCNEIDPDELVIPFDVVDASGGVTEKNLRFKLKYEGFYFLRHSL